MYTSLTNPAANGRLHFAGEALSVRHAWVEGALDSAWRAVAELLLYPGFKGYQQKFYKNWGYNLEWVSGKAEPWTSGKSLVNGEPRDQGKPYIPKPADSLLLQQLVHLNPEHFASQPEELKIRLGLVARGFALLAAIR